MILRRSTVTIGAVMLTTFAACSQQVAAPSTSGTQVASSDPSTACTLDVNRVCQELRNKPVIDPMTGQVQDRTEREQNGSRTDSRFTSYQVPNGSLIQVQCEINNEHGTVVYAHLMPGPPLTPTDIAFIQKNGYCVH